MLHRNFKLISNPKYGKNVIFIYNLNSKIKKAKQKQKQKTKQKQNDNLWYLLHFFVDPKFE